MDLEELVQKIVGSSESKCSCKLELNSRGTNVTLHVYEGVTYEAIKATIDNAIKGLNYANKQVTA